MLATWWGRNRVANNLAGGGADRSAIANHYPDLKRNVKGGYNDSTKSRKSMASKGLRQRIAAETPIAS
jgi:hypothetical protein